MSLRTPDDIITPSLIIVSCDPFELMILQMGVSCDDVDTTRERTGMRYSSLAERRKEMAERDKDAIGVLDIRRGRREKEARERGGKERGEKERGETERGEKERGEKEREEVRGKELDQGGSLKDQKRGKERKGGIER